MNTTTIQPKTVATVREREREREREYSLFNMEFVYSTIWTNLINKSNKINTTYHPRAGLFVEEKIFLANSKVRDG